MFGVVPRALWSRVVTPDEAGRIPLDANCLLARTGDRVVLVETGTGSKLTDKERGFLDLPAGDHLIESLAGLGVRAEDVTDVVLTHLHMDHCGGATRWESETSVPSFPRARLYVQRIEWQDAMANRSHMRVSYREENLRPLAESGRLNLLDGDCEPIPGISVQVTGGHTRGHQCVLIRSAGETLLLPGDVCPTPAHLRPTYTMAFDMCPYDSIRAKRRLLEQAAAEGWLLAFGHEPIRKVVAIRREGSEIQAHDVK